MKRPNKIPKWATNDLIGNIYKQLNKIEPDEYLKQYGFPEKSKIGRNHINYQFNVFCNWITHLDRPIYTIQELTNELAPTAELEGKQVYLKDANVGNCFVYCDGINWKKVKDDSIII